MSAIPSYPMRCHTGTLLRRGGPNRSRAILTVPKTVLATTCLITPISQTLDPKPPIILQLLHRVMWLQASPIHWSWNWKPFSSSSPSSRSRGTPAVVEDEPDSRQAKQGALHPISVSLRLRVAGRRASRNGKSPLVAKSWPPESSSLAVRPCLRSGLVDMLRASTTNLHLRRCRLQVTSQPRKVRRAPAKAAADRGLSGVHS